MADIFISYARSTAKQAQTIAEALRGLGYSVWIDDDLPAHRSYSRVIEEQMIAAKAAVVIWSADAAQSEWVLSESNRAREDRKLVQVTTDEARLPMPFDTIQCADLAGWSGDLAAPGWRKMVASVSDLVGGLGVAVTSPPLPSKPSIAVLPFADMTGAEGQDYFVDGMVAEITTALSRIRSIFVIASSSTLTFKGKGVGAQDAARQLGVRYVLEGSVRKAADRVRIAVQLIDASDGMQIWTQRFDDTLDDVFALQDKVALAVAGQIEPTVQSAEIRRASARPTENMGGYDLYLRGLSLYLSGSRAGYLGALDHLNRAIALDPSYGSALGLAAHCGWLIVVSGWSNDPEADSRQSVALAHRALISAGDDAFALALVAQVVGYLEENVDTAIGMVDRAVALNPGSAKAWEISGALRLATGELDLAVEHSEASIRLDPMGPDRSGQIYVIGIARFLQRRFSEAFSYYREALQLMPDMPDPHFLLACLYGQLGRAEEARVALARFRALTKLTPMEFARLQGAPFQPASLKMFLDSVAMAEGKSPSEGLADGR